MTATEIERKMTEAWENWEALKALNAQIIQEERANPLDAAMVESGVVMVEKGYEDDNIKVSVLTLEPSSKIKTHKHISDEEYYYDLETLEEIGYCEKGGSHSLQNPSGKTLVVLSIKLR